MKKDYVVSIRLAADLFRKIQKEAKGEGLPAAAVIRRTLMRVHGQAQ